jgi:signal transduction histidine kinase/CheY-like chemotaxis protein
MTVRTDTAPQPNSDVLLAAVINCSSELVWIVAPHTFTLLAFNDKFADLILSQYHVKVSVGSPLDYFLPSEELSRQFNDLYRQALETGAFSTQLTTTNQARCLSLNLHVLHHENLPVAICVFARDITAQNKAEALAGEREERYRQIVENAPLGIFRRRVDGPYDYVNHWLLRQFECETEEEYFTNYAKIDQRWVHPEEYKKLEELLLEKRQVLGFESEVRLANGKTKWLLLYAFLDKSNEYINGFAVDITTQKQGIAERERLQEQLHHSQKMDTIGKLAGGVAHDFNNMLSGIVGATELLQLGGNSNEEIATYLDLIMTACGKASDLTSKLLTFARKARITFAPINLEHLLKDTIALLTRTIDKRIAISFENFAALTTAIGDATMLENLLLNMGVNASHAMPNGGTLKFTLRARELEEEYCAVCPFDITPGTFLEIEVRDSGCGMSVEVQKRIFEPFFTTKEQGKGTGLGLAAAYGTIQDHHGAINVYSEVNVGTVFHVYLPLSKGVAVPLKKKTDAIRGTGVILLVDDEDVVRLTAKRILESLGYEVRTASDGVEAVQLYEKSHNEIDLVILDMIMPRMNGTETFHRMRGIDSGAQIVISSGFSKENDLDVLRECGLAGYIWKPFSRAELSQTVADVLRTRRQHQQDQE